ncbi:MAG: hypothetical protein ACJ79Y_06515 [Myxococcales bacterium]
MGRLLVAVSLLTGACHSARTTAPRSPPDAAPSTALESSPVRGEAGTGIGACGGICARGHFPPGSWRPYSKESAFNRKIPANARLMEKSSLVVERLLGDLAQRKQPSNLPMFEDGTSGWPTYWGTAADPLYSISCKWGDCSAAHRKGRAPAGAQMQGGNEAPKDESHDRHLTFIDQTDGTEFDLWHVATSPLPEGGGTIVVDWAGIAKIDGDGRAGCAGEACKGEGNAGRVGNLAGRVRFEELADAIARRSHIDHALGITIRCTDGTAVYPASKNAGLPCSDPAAHNAKGNRHAPPMGARFRLNLTRTGPAADVARIDAMSRVPEWKKVFLRTLVVYGAIVMDTGSEFYFSWQTESGIQYTTMKVADPWFAFARRMTINPETGKPYTDCWTGPPDTDFQVDCLKSRKGDGYVGVWKAKDDGLDWNKEIWPHLEVLHECVSKGTC